MSGEKALRALSTGCAMLMVLSGLTMFAGADNDDEKVRVIVLFKEKVDKQLIEDNNGDVLDTFTLIPGAVAEMTKSDMKALKKSDKVKAAEEEGEASICDDVDADGKGKPQPPAPPAEKMDWGVDKIGADHAWATSTGTGVKVAVLDTGIDNDHPDLKVAGGVNFVANRGKVNSAAWDDDNGHGTHCAGIIAASDNDVGTIGVAPGASLYAVKVLNKSGTGYYSDIIKALQWCVDNGMDVASMSLSGGYSSTLETACNNAQSKGVVLVAAAGNSGSSVKEYPAGYSSVIAVSATDSTDTIAYFSNYGAHISLAAPGVSIFSTYKGGTYTTLSGTSMACPHVSGTAALVLKLNPTWTPEQVQTRLETTADDIGAVGTDEYYGHGLVDADGAVA